MLLIRVECLFSLITDNLDCINEVVYVKIKGESFPVKVVEDPCTEASWENRIVTNIKVKRGMEEDDESPLHSEKDSVAIVAMSKISKDDVMADNLNSNLKDQKFDSLVADTYDGTEKGSATEVSVAQNAAEDGDFVDANITAVHDGFLQVHDSLIPRDYLVPVLVGQVALNEDGLRASQAKGIDLIVDLNLKEGSWRTQSWGEYQLSRGDQSKEASQIQSLKGDQYDFQSLGVGMQRRVGRCISNDRSSSNVILKLERRVRGSKRKIIKKKHIVEIGVKIDDQTLRKRRVFLLHFCSRRLEKLWTVVIG